MPNRLRRRSSVFTLVVECHAGHEHAVAVERHFEDPRKHGSSVVATVVST